MDARPTDADPDPDLPTIPLIRSGSAGPLALVEAEPERFRALLDGGRRHYGLLALALGDRLTHHWLEHTGNPYRDEIASVATRAERPGAFLLNLAYEWTCTTGVGADPAGRGNRLLRTLDWPLRGLGRNLVVARQEGEAGPYDAVTRPGFVGVATAMAPHRFSAAINQPPMRRLTPSCWLDWTLGRLSLWTRTALPPVHLLRRVFDTCRTYAEARAMLTETPLALPAFFTLSGVRPEDGCVIERREDDAAVHAGPTSMANHWRAFRIAGRERGADSRGRLAAMERLRDRAGNGFRWLVPPILNETTRVAVVANAALDLMLVQGWEADGPATAVTTVRWGLDQPARAIGPEPAAPCGRRPSSIRDPWPHRGGTARTR